MICLAALGAKLEGANEGRETLQCQALPWRDQAPIFVAAHTPLHCIIICSVLVSTACLVSGKNSTQLLGRVRILQFLVISYALAPETQVANQDANLKFLVSKVRPAT